MPKKHCHSCHDVEPVYRQAIEPASHWMVPCHPLYVPNQPPVHCHPCHPCGPRMCPPPPMHNPCTYDGYIQAPHPYIFWMNADIERVKQLQKDLDAQAETIAQMAETLATATAQVARNSADITVNSQSIATQGRDIQSLDSRVQVNSEGIGVNSEEIGKLSDDIDTLEASIEATNAAVGLNSEAISEINSTELDIQDMSIDALKNLLGE